MYEPSRQFLSFHVAGFSHWYGLDVLDQLKPGTQLRMECEPDNPYDSNAISLWLGRTKLGYVPAKLSSSLFLLAFFGHGNIFTARVAQVDPDAHPEAQVLVTVLLSDARPTSV
jgi:hypothetical protein